MSKIWANLTRYLRMLGKLDRKRLFSLASTSLRNPWLFTEKRRYLFVLSHMRAYSSLLSHILGSHPQIDGCSEQHLHYHSAFDLFRLRLAVLQESGARLGGELVLDKILHNNRVPPPFFERKDIQFLILVREPHTTLRSMFKMWIAQGSQRSWADCGTDYCVRLRGLGATARSLGFRAHYLRAEDLLERTGSVLHALRSAINLDQPLSEDYQIFAQTGVAGSGDMSPWISKGEIVRKRDAHDLEPCQEVLAKCQAAYKVLMAELDGTCKRV